MEKYFTREDANWMWTVDLNYHAALAVDLVKNYGIISAKDDGEDTQGRAKIKLLSPEEVVDRCCTIADLLVEEFEARGWIREDMRTAEEIAKRKGELAAIQADVTYDFESLLRKARKEHEASAK